MTVSLPERPIVRIAAATVLCVTSIGASAAEPVEGGVLDRPFAPVSTPGRAPATPPGLDDLVSPGDIRELQRAVRAELAALEKLDRPQLQARADAGERAAQIALGIDYAREATLLGFAPAAANAALADAARWYSIAASRGFPGAPSLDIAGVRLYPIRVQREPVR